MQDVHVRVLDEQIRLYRACRRADHSEQLDGFRSHYELQRPPRGPEGRAPIFEVPERRAGSRGPAPSAPGADRPARQVSDLAAALGEEQFQTLAVRAREGQELVSRFAMVRVIAANLVDRDRRAAREEWLIIEWPAGHEHPSDYWISNLPADTTPQRLAQLARLRWTIELDYRQLKGELGLDHYEGRCLAGLGSPHRAGHRRPRIPDPRTAAPFSPTAGLTLEQTVLLLQPLFKCWTGHCQTCQQPVDLDQLSLHRARQNE